MVPLVGVVVVDKPLGLSSAQVVHRLRHALGEKTAGHTGTLDPIASGVLPICLNGATKLAGYLIADDKRYWTKLLLGVETTTLDRTGDIVRVADVAAVAAITTGDVAAAVARFVGPQAQVPPMFSAIKVDGKRLYERARQGQVIERAPRDIVIHDIKLVLHHGAIVELDVHCSKGTYIRSLAEDIGRSLGVGAHVVELRRLASGRFLIEQALPQERWTRDEVAAVLVPLADATGLPCVEVADALVPRVLCGETVLPHEFAIPAEHLGGGLFQLCRSTVGAHRGGATSETLLAIVHIGTGRVRYDRVFK
jgi:tRNA pseudouridine55 synthase